jgi:hypothetical protein
MKTAFPRLVAGFLFAGVLCTAAQTPIDKLHGDEKASTKGLHSGNMIRTTFYNDGMYGIRYNSPSDIGGEWPINSGHLYIHQLITFIGAEVKDQSGEIKHIFSESNGCSGGNSSLAESGDSGPGGEWYSMTPLPGFHNPVPPPDDNGIERIPTIAMSHQKWTWPASWPDKTEDKVDPGWPGSWNGYFGKDVLNADQESYFVMDDYNNREFAFYPDSTDSLRRGLGLRATLRGLQWSNVLVEDVMFILYDAKNIGTGDLAKMNFGLNSGPIIGTTITVSGDGADDGGGYLLDEDVGYHNDKDNIGAGGWTPVGYEGLAFFESPGNPYDGIDNDNDAGTGSGITVTSAMFDPKTVNAGDQIVLIDYRSFDRTLTAMPAGGVDIAFHGRTVHIAAGQELTEVPNNLFDDNLNGIIDENNGSSVTVGGNRVTRYLYEGLKCVDYFTGAGLDNPMIDEKRDDGMDNDGNWNPLTDDVGLDGVPKTGDYGEGDGKPTSGWQRPGVVTGSSGKPNKYGLVDTGLPGEPHIDKTDIHESDMIGLTAFNIYSWPEYPNSNDEKYWEGIMPGFLNADQTYFADTDLLLGSGYFPLKTKQIERFSLGVVMGTDMDDMVRNKRWAQQTYSENYNFAKAPYIPTVTAIAGDNRVTLMWDDVAENSMDPITGKDFEGYRIYRSTDPAFKDMKTITDVYGSAAYLVPVAQFDLVDGIRGLSGTNVRGIHFWLGSDTGLEHMWADTTVRNGQKYYYAVTSYDRGSDALGISPTECSKYISIAADGKIDMGKNVVIARPEAPSAGFVASDLEDLKMQAGSTATGSIRYKIVDPGGIKDGHRYRITFEDSLVTVSPITRVTKNFTLADVTDESNPDTLIDKSRRTSLADKQPVTDGFRLTLVNEASLALDAKRSSWNRPGIYGFLFTTFAFSQTKGVPEAADYRIEFGEVGMDTASSFVRGTKEIPGGPVNFTVYKLFPSDTGEVKVKSRFGFYEQDGKIQNPNVFSAFSAKNMLTDQIIMLSDAGVPGFMFQMDKATFDSLKTGPQPGDVATMRLKKPYLSHDRVEFITRKEYIDEALAKRDLNDIKVVPNPYVVANSFEPPNPYSSGRGPRELHFTHLPEKCTIKIFNVRGQLVTTLEHDSPAIADGTEIWNMLTKDQMDIAYGVYVFHVDAGRLGTKVGKFAVIK